MDIAYYREPGQLPIKQKGNWTLTSLEEIAPNTFFITTFSKDKVYQFKPLASSSNLSSFNFLSATIQTESKEEYIQSLTDFIDQFSNKNIEKAVYSRVVKTQALTTQQIQDIFTQLCIAYPTTFVYLISSPLFGTWMGATPETLLSGSQDEFETMSLAGTKLNVNIPWGEKELEEQQYVTDFIASNLKKNKVENLKINKRETVFTGAVYHLKTKIAFETNFSNWKKIVNILHPTPAVCGMPTQNALRLILNIEKHNRQFYAGIIGFSKGNNLNTYVNLRCMQLKQNNTYLYVGGGITNKSIPENEFQETENKANTLLRVISAIKDNLQ